MKTVIVFKGASRRIRAIEVPESWAESRMLLLGSLDPYNDRRGGNVERLSAAARVAYAMFPSEARDPTCALIRLMLRLCEREEAA